jgi:hypothetical protein
MEPNHMTEERIVIRVGADRYDVIAVRCRLNDKPLSKAEADRLANSPASAAPPSRHEYRRSRQHAARTDGERSRHTR